MASPVESLLDFVNNVPHPLTSVLVHLAPIISVIAQLAEIVSWRRSWYNSFLALAAWWAVCLLASPALRYLFPFLCLFCFPSIAHHPPPAKSPPTTEQSLQTAITNLITIQSLLPTIPTFPLTRSSRSILRVLVLTYPPYLMCTHYIPLRIIIACSGSVLLTHRAPWSVLLRATVKRSAWSRYAMYHINSFLTGNPLFVPLRSQQPVQTSPIPVPALRFLFTLYENQRWWVGLDWTAALLPAERPSWCSASYHPVSPPTAFTLPEPTIVYLPNPGKEGGRVKRTATWAWEEPEWRVLVRKEGGGVSRVERPLPKEEGANGSRLLKAAGKMREAGIGPAPAFPEGDEGAEEDAEQGDSNVTDADGWVYGDNKWEGLSSKGGMGKYTRHRRWTRVAVVSETVEIVPDGEIGILRAPESYANDDTNDSYPLESSALFQDKDLRNRAKQAHAKESSVESVTVNGATTIKPIEEESPLRQRLRRALSKPAGAVP